MSEQERNQPWIDRWESGQIGWHEPDGNANLKQHWRCEGRRVLVPLCGKTPDLAWLAARGNEVVGIEVSTIAAEAFFAERGLEYEQTAGDTPVFSAAAAPITIVCGDYFDVRPEHTGGDFDACYDRGALVAIPPESRDRYVQTTRSLLKTRADYLLIAVEYDQSVAPGPPFSVDEATVQRFLPGLERVADVDDLANCPPKFLDAGLDAFREVVYRGELAPD
ncbi:MAG: thiopurine S-methyltransferase [Pseudomonadota bacterium]